MLEVYGRRVLLEGVLESFAYNNDAHMVHALVEMGACDFDSKDSATFNGALMAAAQGGHTQMCQYFIARGVTDYENALYAAASHGHKEVCQLLMGHGASDVEEALMAAAAGDYADVCALMTARGAAGKWAVHGAAFGGHRAVCDNLLAQAPADQLQTELESGLLGAACGKRLDLCQYFVQLGAVDFEVAMMAAADGGSVEVITYLVDTHGARQFAPAILRSARMGHIDATEYFMTKGVTVQALVAALVEAAYMGHRNVCVMLRDALPATTPLDAAVRSAESTGFVDVAALLRR